MIPLVTLLDAKRHLNIMPDDTDRDEDIVMKIRIASELVMTHYKASDVPQDWIKNNSPLSYDIPYWAKAATLLVMAELHYNREASISNPMSEAVKALIPRTPTVA